MDFLGLRTLLFGYLDHLGKPYTAKLGSKASLRKMPRQSFLLNGGPGFAWAVFLRAFLGVRRDDFQFLVPLY